MTVLVPPQLKKPEIIAPCAVNQRDFAGTVTPCDRDDVKSSERLNF